MRHATIAGCIAALALIASPTFALSSPPVNDGTTNAAAQKAKTPGPDASATSKAKAYGKKCQGQSKKKVGDAKRSPFSLCVNAMAKVATDDDISPKAACKPLSKKRVGDAKHSPFVMCVHAANDLRKAQQAGS